MNDNLNPQEPIFKEMVAHYKTVTDFPIHEVIESTEPSNGR